MPLLPALQSGERVFLPLGAADLDQGKLRSSPLGGLHPGRLTFLFLVVGRPGGVAQALALVFGRQLQQKLE